MANPTANPTPDLSKLIDLDLLQLFGQETIVPINRTIASLAQAVAGLNTGLEKLADATSSEETSPAQAAHTIGSYLIYAGDLYKVISAISVGDTLTAGTNIRKTTVAEELENNDVGFSVQNGILCVTFEEE